MKSKIFEKMFDNPPPKMGTPKPEDIPRMPLSRIPHSHEEIQTHLKSYLNLIKEQGADDARIVNVRDIPQDPRVLLKCHFPKCPVYGLSGSCPPYYTGDFQKAQEYINAYKWAIVYRVDIPEEGRKYVTGPTTLDTVKNKDGRHKMGSMWRYCFNIGDVIESTAYYDGHYFAINCHFGPCIVNLCEEFDFCQEIKTGICRFPTIAKPSIEQTFCVRLKF